MNPYRLYILWAAFLCCYIPSFAQRAVTSIVTNSTTLTPTSITAKGAGLTNSTGVRSSLWDSVGTSFTVNYGNGTDNRISITQLTVTGKTNPYTTTGVNSEIRVRRSASPYVGNTRLHYNYWAVSNSMPASNATNGIFNIKAPMPSSDTGIIKSNNINLGFDNLFQNTIASLHSSNIERVDVLLNQGLVPNSFDIDNAGTVVFDRGAGDTFKIAVILSIDASGNPLSYGPLRAVSGAQFGPNLLGTNFNYCLFTSDVQFGATARPSSNQAQNIRGVFLTLGELGMTAGQTFYGYSLFGYDVVTADPNWLNYPTNTNNLNQIDPVGVFVLFKDINSVLAMPVDLHLSRQNGRPFLRYEVKDASSQTIFIERSTDGQNFTAIDRQNVMGRGTFEFIDYSAPSGTVYYRLQVMAVDGTKRYSDIRSLNSMGLELSVYPNPATGYLNIRGSGLVGSTANLVNLSGQTVRRVPLSSDNTKFPLAGIGSGLYFLMIESGREQRKYKVWVKPQ